MLSYILLFSTFDIYFYVSSSIRIFIFVCCFFFLIGNGFNLSKVSQFKITHLKPFYFWDVPLLKCHVLIPATTAFIFVLRYEFYCISGATYERGGMLLQILSYFKSSRFVSYIRFGCLK